MTIDSTIRALLAPAAGTLSITSPEGRWFRDEVVQIIGGIAAELRRRGVGPGELVAVRCGGSVWDAMGQLAVRAVGGVALPLAVHQIEEIGDVPVRYALSEGQRTPWTTLSAPDCGRADLVVQPSADVAWAVPTSGTSGQPKLVLLSDTGIDFVARAIQQVLGYRASDQILLSLPLHHTYGLSQIWLAARTGARLVVPRSRLPGDLLEALQGTTIVPTVTPALDSLIDRLPTAPRIVTLAGQGTPPALRARFARTLPHTAFVICYGLTEASTRVLMLPADEFLTAPRATGRPLLGTRVWLDDEGELCLSGPNVALGYLNAPEQSQMRFRDGALRSGDLFTYEDGRYTFVGRRDSAFKRYGEKVVPERVEAVLDGIDGVSACRVFPEAGRGPEVELVAEIVRSDPNLTPGAILRMARARLPPAMVPTQVRFCGVLPRTASGKISRRPPQHDDHR